MDSENLLRTLNQMVNYRFSFLVNCLLVCAFAATEAGAEDGWGTLTGRFQFDGPAPDDEPIVLNVNNKIAPDIPIYDERLIVNPDGMGLMNVAVWLNTSRGADEPPIHPDYLQSSDNPFMIRLDGFTISPHVATVWTKRIVEFINNNSVGYSPRVSTLRPENSPIHQLVPAGRSSQFVFKKGEVLPVRVNDSIHRWMNSWLIVQEHPYTAATDVNGVFRIEKIPAGKWRFRFWHESAGYLQEVDRDGKPEQWRRGEAEILIRDGETTNLGVVKIKAAKFSAKASAPSPITLLMAGNPVETSNSVTFPDELLGNRGPVFQYIGEEGPRITGLVVTTDAKDAKFGSTIRPQKLRVTASHLHLAVRFEHGISSQAVSLTILDRGGEVRLEKDPTISMLQNFKTGEFVLMADGEVPKLPLGPYQAQIHLGEKTGLLVNWEIVPETEQVQPSPKATMNRDRSCAPRRRWFGRFRR